MRSNYRPIGDYIRLVDERNKELKITTLLGLSITKEFIPSVANTVGTNMRNYKIVRKNQFACSIMQVRRDKKMPVAILKDFKEAIISQAYPVFEVIDEDLLHPDYLMMWFSREEFDRQATFHAVGGVRGSLEWEDFLSFELPVPSIEKQREIVAEYNVVKNRIKLNEQLNQKLEETAQALYKHWFVDFEFPCLPSDYRPHGQVNLKISDNELKSEIAQVCNYKRTGGLPISDGRTWFVYLILCDDDSIYKGITNDLYRRFYEHYTAQGAKHTKQHKPVKVIHWEQFDTKEAAAKREKELKTGYGRTWIDRQIKKAGGLEIIKAGLPAPKTQLRTAGKMVYNEELDKEIPEGWKDGSFLEALEISGGGTPRTQNPDYWNGNIPFFTPKDVNDSYYVIESEKTLTEEGLNNCSSKLYSKNTIFITARGTVGEISIAGTEMSMNQSCYAFTEPDCLQFYGHQLAILTIKELIGEAVGAVFSALVTKDFQGKSVIIPPKYLKKLFNRKIEQFYFSIRSKEFQNIQLYKLKNLLLSRMANVKKEKEMV
ncbi:type I restriction enzyme, S subunit [Salegentibacter echinorum]|uniref:Type I restriction enzyme, S subunit n=1 Tax=Salegentibacter echinorum TaxID=1073325 RepID=A0A1M5K6W7_SALEC|nr:restriction endonuclease subunit S [Salegentibacter echinorum]SHG48552.1 type I restriction enzyme, S subunit [Salegentibacter echinorum]